MNIGHYIFSIACCLLEAFNEDMEESVAAKCEDMIERNPFKGIPLISPPSLPKETCFFVIEIIASAKVWCFFYQLKVKKPDHLLSVEP